MATVLWVGPVDGNMGCVSYSSVDWILLMGGVGGAEDRELLDASVSNSFGNGRHFKKLKLPTIAIIYSMSHAHVPPLHVHVHVYSWDFHSTCA